MPFTAKNSAVAFLGRIALATIVCLSLAPARAGTPQTITFNPQGAQTYVPGGIFTINPLATSTSGLAVTYSSTTPSICTVSGINVNILAAGTCTIQADQGGDATYNAAPPVTRNVNIAKRNQAITFGPQAPQTFSPGGTFTPTASATSGLPVALGSLTAAVCTASGTLVTIVSAGTCTLTANQAGDSNTNPAAPLTQSVTISPAPSVSGPSPTGTGTITAVVSGGGAGCNFTAAQFIPLVGNPASPPAGSAPQGVTFPHGLFDFILAGCTPGAAATITVTYPSALPGGTVYWKYGPTPGNAAAHWYVLPATISGNVATLIITDGALGDDDLTANGVIADQGGPGVPGTLSVPTLSNWVLLVLALMMLGAGGSRLRSRRG